jgi:hypothetical protein
MDDLREQLSGQGKLFNAGEFLGAVQYKVRVYRERVPTTTHGGPSQIPGVRHAECHLEPSPGVGMLRKRLTLVMSDGRKLDLVILGENAVQPTGPIYT